MAISNSNYNLGHVAAGGEIAASTPPPSPPSRRPSLEGSQVTRTAQAWARVSVSGPTRRPSTTELTPATIGLKRTIQEQDSEGQALRVEHTYNGKVLGLEVATRIPGEKALRLVLKRTYENTQDPAKKEALTDAYTRLKSDPILGKRKFFDADYHREAMTEALDKHVGPLEGKDYAFYANKTNPGLVNARNMTLMMKGKVYGLLRLGVMSDLRNGAVNLRQLQQIKDGKLNPKDLQAKLLQEQKKYAQGSRAHASLQMAIDQLNTPETALKDRQGRMELLMLQYLSAHAERDAGKLGKMKSPAIWDVVDVRLLNPQKNEMDRESGWVHDEANELLDMKEIFKQFEGRTIVLDGKGPYIDEEGKVHLALDNGGQEISLNPKLINISVQGQMENSGLQKELNEEALNELDDHPELKNNPDWKEMRQMLASGQSNGTVAEKALTALVQAGISVSAGCLSGKDRTGWVVGRTMIKLMANTQETIRKYLTGKLIGPNSMASKILKDVTGWHFMKLDYRTMGEDATLGVKIKHTAGLVAEWGIKKGPKILLGLAKQAAEWSQQKAVALIK
jgi:hypothetical protein